MHKIIGCSSYVDKLDTTACCDRTVVRPTGEARDVLSCVECPFDRHQLIPIAIDYSQSMPMYNVYLSFGNAGWVESPVFDAAVQF